MPGDYQPLIDWNAAAAVSALRRLPLSTKAVRLLEAVEALTRGREGFVQVSRRILAQRCDMTLAEVREAIDESCFGHPAEFMRCLQDNHGRPIMYRIDWQAVFAYEPESEADRIAARDWGRLRILDELRLREQLAR